LFLAGLYSDLESQAKNNDRAVSQELIARTEVEVRRVEHFIRERLGGKVS